jgi:glycosyltransferase involved in cell wall biosynthesis
MLQLSVIMPAYNEEEGIERAVHDIRRDVLALVKEAELVIVNDGSKDRTGALLDQLAAEDPRIRVFHQGNQGHGPALRAGLDTAQGDFLLLVDSDGQIPLENFATFWRMASTSDGIIGIRQDRRDPRHRLVLSSAVRLLLRILFDIRVADANIPFKLIRSSVWREARPIIPADCRIPSLFLAVFLATRSDRFKQISVSHRARETGKATLQYGGLATFCWCAMRQLILFRRNLYAGIH